ncbi:MAG: signal peptidase I [Pseudomonadota bacterium]
MDVKTQSPLQGDLTTQDNRGIDDLRNPNLRPKPQKDDSLFGFVMFLVKLVALILIVRIFIIAPFSIPSESMQPRLWNGDYLIASKWPYGYSRNSLFFDAPWISGRVLARTPTRGDVVIFKHPVSGEDYIKRVIGVPGDTVAMRGGQIVLNEETIAKERLDDFEVPISPNTPCASGGREVTSEDGEALCRYPRFRETLPGGRSYDVLDLAVTAEDLTTKVTVGEGQLFVMGDNRDRSMDSRFPPMAGLGTGLVPEANLVGRAEMIVWSTDGSAEWLEPWTWFSAARWNRIGALL